MKFGHFRRNFGQELEELLKTERTALGTLKVTHATDVASRGTKFREI